MKIKILKKVGNKEYTFDIDNPDFNEAYREAAKVDRLPIKCDVCGSDDLSLAFKKPKGFNYPGIKCNACGANTVIQGRKDGSEDFVKPMEKYNPEKKQTEEPDPSVERVAPF